MDFGEVFKMLIKLEHGGKWRKKWKWPWILKYGVELVKMEDEAFKEQENTYELNFLLWKAIQMWKDEREKISEQN